VAVSAPWDRPERSLDPGLDQEFPWSRPGSCVEVGAGTMAESKSVTARTRPTGAPVHPGRRARISWQCTERGIRPVRQVANWLGKTP